MQHMMQETSPQSAAAVTALLSMRNGRIASYPKVSQTYSALDLCIRRRDRTPPSSPEYLEDQQMLDSTPTTTTRLTCSPISQPESERSDSSLSSSDHAIAYSSQNLHNYSTPLSTSSRIKPTRPFKAYPKDPLVLALGVSSSEALLGSDSTTEAYTEFRNRMLSQVKGGQGITNKNMRRSTMASNVPEDPSKNEAYWEKRRKNNEAAKRSRDARRAKEDEIAIRAAFLEHENLKLKYELASLKKETEKLRNLVYTRN